MRSFIEPRGLSALAPKLLRLDRYAVTGSMAVPGGVAPARLAMIYVADAKEAANALERAPTETGANVWLLEPYDAVVFERTRPVKWERKDSDDRRQDKDGLVDMDEHLDRPIAPFSYPPGDRRRRVVAAVVDHDGVIDDSGTDRTVAAILSASLNAGITTAMRLSRSPAVNIASSPFDVNRRDVRPRLTGMVGPPYGRSTMQGAKAVDSDPETALLASRRYAAEQSGGHSEEAVYSAVERELAAIDQGGDVLDYGAGIGVLTARLHASNRFRTTTGTDLYARPANLAAEVQWIEADLNDPLPLPSASFDTVVAAEVIEHLENPRAMCRDIFRLLRPGGRALLTTPNNETWRAMMAFVVRGHFVAFGDGAYPAHITALNRSDLDRALKEVGFLDLRFTYTGEGRIPWFTTRTWQSLLGKRAAGLRFSDNVLVTARKPS